MSYSKSKQDLLNNELSLSKALEDHWDFDEWRYDDYWDSYCGCMKCRDDDVEYEYKEGRGSMIDLDSISIERKRNSRIARVLGEESDKTTISDIAKIKKSNG